MRSVRRGDPGLVFKSLDLAVDGLESAGDRGVFKFPEGALVAVDLKGRDGVVDTVNGTKQLPLGLVAEPAPLFCRHLELGPMVLDTHAGLAPLTAGQPWRSGCLRCPFEVLSGVGELAGGMASIGARVGAGAGLQLVQVGLELSTLVSEADEFCSGVAGHGGDDGVALGSEPCQPEADLGTWLERGSGALARCGG